MRWLPLKLIFLIFGSFAANSTGLSVATGFTVVVEEAEDDVTIDLFVERMQVHEKNAWMLRSLINPNKSATQR